MSLKQNKRGSLQLINKTMKRLIKSIDMFSVSQFTLYRGDQKYGTLTGGIASLAVIGILLTIFFTMTISIFNKTNVTTTIETITQSNPSYYKAVANPKNKFMFAVAFYSGIDNYLQYFDIDTNLITYNQGDKSASFNSMRLEKCTPSHWQGISDQVTKGYYYYQLQNYLCPPLNYELQMQGKQLSQKQQYMQILINLCTPNSSDCQASGVNATKYGEGIIFSFLYVNAIINQNNQNSITYYIQDSNVFQLDEENYVQSFISLLEYQITTDQSLMPWQSLQIQRGIFTDEPPFIRYKAMDTIAANTFGSIFLQKGSKKILVKRSFKKIVDVLAFVGGLLSPTILALSILKLYNKYSYELQFGDRIFKKSNNSSFGSEDFNLISFLKCGIFSILKGTRIAKNWTKVRDYYRCRQQSIKQLDIHLLFKKIQFFEEVCNTVLDKHHLVGLHLLTKKTLSQSKTVRKRHMLQAIIYKQLQNKGRFVNIEDEEFKKVRQAFLQMERQNEDESPNFNEHIAQIQKQFSKEYKRLMEQGYLGQKHSQKIMVKLKEKKQEYDLLSVPQIDGKEPDSGKVLNTFPTTENFIANQIIHRQKQTESEKSEPTL